MARERDSFPQIPEQIGGIGGLAYNLWWSWHPSARMLYKMLSRPEWKESVHNPVKMLRELPGEVFQTAANAPEYVSHYSTVMNRFRSDMEENRGWFSTQNSGSPQLPIAYFSAEYGLHRSLPFYAGGLGFLAGDYLKECSDLGIPLVAVGFMYPEGYILQRIREDGWWIEGCNSRNGWTFGEEAGEDRDRVDAEAMYDLLKKKIIPLYYAVDDDGISRGWVKVMKEAMKSVGPAFSARRMVKEYVGKFYREALDHVH